MMMKNKMNWTELNVRLSKNWLRTKVKFQIFAKNPRNMKGNDYYNIGSFKYITPIFLDKEQKQILGTDNHPLYP